MALAIENAWLYEETRRRLAETQSLQRVTAALLQQLSQGETLEIVCTEAMQLVGAGGSAVLLMEEGGGLRVAHGAGTAFVSGGHPPAEEALNNVLKHARARCVTVALRFSPNGAYLEMSDDGVGFDPQVVLARGGLGISGMKERAEQLGVELKIDSTPGMGTRVWIDVSAWEPLHLEV